MDEALVSLTEAEAARAGKSLSDFISEIVAREVTPPMPDGEESNPQIEALRRIWAGPMWDVTEDGRMPTAEERNARR
ncbi:MAG TPA: hypothetical protein VGN97_01790 [Mesorhizobium sp.]|nr:hypothetical protein [Mesorhizobium sp.]